MHWLFRTSQVGFHAGILAGVLTAGCAPSKSGNDKPASTPTTGTQSTAPANQTSEKSTASNAKPTSVNTDSGIVSSDVGSSATPAEQASSVKAENKPAVKSTVAQTAKPAPQAEPASVREAIELIDLRSLPRLKEKSILELGATMVYYSAQGSVAAVDAMLKSELSGRGWKDQPGFTPPTEQYVDRVYEHKGFHLRASISTGSTAGEVGVNISNVGNVDVRNLPKTTDAEPIESTAINATHRTSKSIPQVISELEPKMKEAGWQVCEDFYSNPIDVPHFKSISFRKNGMKVNLGVVRNPQNAGDKTTVYYHADMVLPFDIPSAAPMLKLDPISAKAKHELDGGREAVLAMVQKSSDRFGWKLLNANEFEKGNSTTLVADTGREERIVIGNEEADGKNWITYQRVIVPKKPENLPTDNLPSTEDNPQVASASTDSNPGAKESAEIRDGVEAQMNNFQSEVKNAIEDELSKALGSMKGNSNKSVKDLQEMQNKALEMLKNAGVDSGANDSVANTDSDENANADAPVPEDTEEVAPADRNIKRTFAIMKHGSKKVELKHAIAYVTREYGSPVKCIVLSSSPIKEEVAKQKLSKGLSLSTYDLVPDFSSPTLELKIDEYSVSMNVSMDGMSMSTNNSSIVSTVRYRDKKLQGRVTMSKPMDVQDKDFSIEVDVAQPVLQFERVAPGTPVALSQDTEYDFPFPSEVGSKSIERSPFRTSADVKIQSSVNASIDFFTTELEKNGWKKSNVETPVNRFAYENGDRSIRIRLLPADDETQATIVVRDAKAAKTEGMLPPAGKVLLVFGNAGESDVEISVEGKKHSLKAGQGAKDPKSALRIEVAPGKHKVEWKQKNDGKTSTEEVDVEGDTTWGLIYAEFGPLVLQMY